MRLSMLVLAAVLLMMPTSTWAQSPTCDQRWSQIRGEVDKTVSGTTLGTQKKKLFQLIDAFKMAGCIQPPPVVTASLNGSYAPPLARIVDDSLQRIFTFGAAPSPDPTPGNFPLLLNGVPTDAYAATLAKCADGVYAHNTDPASPWYRWNPVAITWEAKNTNSLPCVAITLAAPADVTMSWDAVPFGEMPVGYTVYLDGVVAASVLQSNNPSTSVRLVMPTLGEHQIAVTADKRADDGGLLQSAPVAIGVTVRPPQ